MSDLDSDSFYQGPPPGLVRIALRQLEATVINSIWPEVVFFTLIATMVAVVSDEKIPLHHNLGISDALLTVLGTVLGLVFSFRVSSAYERYSDGRKIWTTITTASASFAKQIWIYVPVDRTGMGRAANTTPLQNTIEKRTMINLILAFSVSVKHFLRNEAGIYYKDLYPLVCFLPKYANRNPNESEKLPQLPEYYKDYDGQPVGTPATQLGRQRRFSFDSEMSVAPESERPLRPARNPPATNFSDLVPPLRFFKYVGDKLFLKDRPSKYRNRRPGSYVDSRSNIPLEIILVLSNYNSWCLSNGLLHPSVANGIMTKLTILQDALSSLGRVSDTPLPYGYQVHLKMSLWFYLIFLPFQISNAFGYLTIPATALTAFLLLGLLEIAQQIEHPFNYGLNSLDLDRFCYNLQLQLYLITAHPKSKPSDFIFSPSNQPFAPADRRNALELVQSDTTHHLP